jgi:hypothetical protein
LIAAAQVDCFPSGKRCRQERCHGEGDTRVAPRWHLAAPSGTQVAPWWHPGGTFPQPVAPMAPFAGTRGSRPCGGERSLLATHATIPRHIRAASPPFLRSPRSVILAFQYVRMQTRFPL